MYTIRTIYVLHIKYILHYHFNPNFYNVIIFINMTALRAHTHIKALYIYIYIYIICIYI